MVASVVKILPEPGIQQSSKALAAADGGLYLAFLDNLSVPHVLKANADLNRMWSLPLASLAGTKTAWIEMADRSLLVLGQSRKNKNRLFGYYISSLGQVLDSAEIQLPNPTGAALSNPEPVQLLLTKNGEMCFVGSLQVDSERLPFLSFLTPNLGISTFRPFHPDSTMLEAQFTVSGFQEIESEKFILIGDVYSFLPDGKQVATAFFSSVVRRDGTVENSQTFRRSIHSSDLASDYRNLSRLWPLFPGVGEHFTAISTPASKSSDQRSGIFQFDRFGQCVDSSFFMTSDFQHFTDVFQKRTGGFILLGSARYPNFGVSINFKKEGLILSVSEKGVIEQFTQPAYISSNSLASCCRLKDNRAVVLGDVLNPQDQQINLILIKLNERDFY